jgi:hypothetical protein
VFVSFSFLVSHLGWWTIYVHFDHFVFFSWFVLASAGFACPYAHSVCWSCSWKLPLSLKLLCLWIVTLPLDRVFVISYCSSLSFDLVLFVTLLVL